MLFLKKKRLLMARLFYSKDDFQAALHFLSRKFPDIHEKLQIYSVNSKTDFLNSQVINPIIYFSISFLKKNLP